MNSCDSLYLLFRNPEQPCTPDLAFATMAGGDWVLAMEASIHDSTNPVNAAYAGGYGQGFRDGCDFTEGKVFREGSDKGGAKRPRGDEDTTMKDEKVEKDEKGEKDEKVEKDEKGEKDGKGEKDEKDAEWTFEEEGISQQLLCQPTGFTLASF